MDQGGFNNIRLVFEYVAVIAAITGRTLVLPPPQPWYLINTGQIHNGEAGGITDFGDMFEIAALKKIIPLITTEEFIREASEHLSIPDAFMHEGVFDCVRLEQNKAYLEWKEWLSGNTEVMPWNPYNDLICFPDIESTRAANVLQEHYVDGRKLVELTPWAASSAVLHFPSTNQQRCLGPVATMLAAADDNIPRLARRFIKHHIRYRDEVFEMAEKLIDCLGMYRYAALHIRRNDFQYSSSRANAEVTLNNIESLLVMDEPLYIATDETDDAFLDVFRAHHHVYRWDDLLYKSGFNKGGIPFRYFGLIEQLICAGARRFIGTNLSTFSAYIVRLRGYSHAPDVASLYHTQSYDGPDLGSYTEDHSGREYLRENPLFWLDC